MGKKHPLDLLYETKGLNGYQFQDWMKERTTQELDDLDSLANSLKKSVDIERKMMRGE